MTHTIFSRRLIALFVLGAIACGPSLAWGSVLPTDTLGETPLSALAEGDADLAPDIAAAAGVLVAPDGRVLWSREPDAERSMASTTKIMTALVVLEHADLDDSVTVSARAASVGQASAQLVQGASYELRTLLEAVLVRSGNDAAVALAEHVAGDLESFVELMNETASRMGLASTRFANPHGLDADGHHTSARDLATLARVAMSDPEIRRMVQLPAVTVESARGPVRLENSNLLIGSFEGATGVKTGWTRRAGYSLVASAERDGIELVAVVLGTDSEDARFVDARQLLEWGFAHYRTVELVEAGDRVGHVRVADYLDVTVETRVGESVNAEVFDIDGELLQRMEVPAEVSAPVRAGERVGTLSFVQGDRLVAQVPLLAAADVERPSAFKRLQIAFVRAWRAVFGDADTRSGEVTPAPLAASPDRRSA